MYSRLPDLTVLWLLAAGLPAAGVAQVIQNPANPIPAQAPAQTPTQLHTPTPQAPMEAVPIRPTYVLGPNDQMIIRAKDADELNEKTFRVAEDGSMTLPLVGNIKAAGRTVQQLEADIAEQLKTLIVNPQVTIVVTVYRLDPVYFLGAFIKPGVYALEGRQTLVDMLIRVGGLQPNGSRFIRLTRKRESGAIPLPGAVEDPVSKSSTVDISIASLSDNVNPAEDLVLAPNDVITASKAEKVYVQGAFMKTGVLDLDERESLSAMQVITMSGGFQLDAEPSKAQILRPVLNTARRAVIPVDLKQVMATKANDFPLLPNDVLFVPSRKSRFGLLGKAAVTIIPATTGIILFILSRM